MMKRILAAASLAALVLPIASAASAATRETALYEYGTDKKSWFWQRQISEEVGGAGSPGDVSQRVTLPSPQSPDTLPVAVENGEEQKVSSIYFNLLSRGVEAGADITKFVLWIEESSADGEHPSINADGKKIQACPIEEIWPSGESEQWKGRPPYDDSDCANGKRTEKKDVATWTFNLSEQAAAWGEDPAANSHGVMLVPVIKGSGPSETWQINLKVPARDDDATPDDESKTTRKRAGIELAYEPAPPEDDTLDDSGSLSGGTTTTTTTGSSFPSSSSPSTSFTPSTSDSTTPAPAPSPTDDAEGIQAAPVAGEQTTPTMPPVVWALIPALLLGLAAVRSVVMEPVGGPRPDGAIAAIRRLNAQARGVSADQAPVPYYVRAMTSLRESVRSAPRRIGDSFTKLTRRLRRR